MSIVNDMLKALEQREAMPSANGDEVYFDYLSSESPAADSDVKPRYGIIIGLCVISVVGGYFATQFLKDESSAQTTPPNAVVQASTPVQPIAVETEVPVAQVNLMSLVEEDKSTQFSARIEQLLRDGQLALLNDRLTEPVDDNAFTRFQSVLLLEPSHVEALAGVQAIVQRYVDFVDQTRARGDTKLAKTYWAKAQFIAGQFPSVNYWLQSSYPEPLWDDKASSNADLMITHVSTPSREAVATADSSQQDKLLRVEPSEKFQDQKIAEQAAVLMREGRWHEAEQLLVNVLESNPQFQASRKGLFDLYLQQKNRVAAEQVLTEMAALTTPEKALLKARVATQFEDWQAARDILEQDLSHADQDVEYRALLAAIYHQLGQHHDAIAQYQQLIAIDSHNATYWLGLAVSFDAIADKSGALRAFRFARINGGLDTATFAYVEQRIKMLSGSDAAG